MHDLKAIRDNPDAFDAGLARRGLAPRAGEILALDREARKYTQVLNELQTRRNAASKAIGQAKAKSDEAEAKRLMAEVESIKGQLPAAEAEQKRYLEQLNALLAELPNLPAPDVPDGADEAANVELRRWGEPKEIAGAKEHFEIGEALGQMDFETAAAMSGARFVLLKGQLARLERALANFMLDLHTGAFGYEEVVPPLLVRDGAVFGTGQLPKFALDLFGTNKTQVFSDSTSRSTESKRSEAESKTEVQVRESVTAVLKSDLWLIPTAEVPLTNIVREKILDADDLPLRFTAWTPCFRSEAGAAGKDTRGMIRLHQFSKVELVSVTTPETSDEEHERMTECAEEALKRLGLPFRTMVLCAGDMGFSARKTYDIEVWLPGQGRYREISSCSNCGDFQARRMKARFRAKGDKQTRCVHTLNGSGLAVGRTLVAILENYQQPDGSVVVPEALVPYMGGVERIEKT
ncbi:serine--tRNA ligase [Amphiplicatus metriothermophilus]|uniref:Serine--tRNA ligase n=1 Tax=Amphiplicatus metriothermophilus TaxID=1519374 RepID=A0A239PU67_9PROT|nr:serine--tRNA ligase [Amphiplicatus metriothermophilus]MBB5519487.1 seryl-tRNA synthetase [Amphiplicatus metriothermophilus]SNT73720.1 seryl-tRNA synthetase [Amphiplicatus metriothermophilus]